MPRDFIRELRLIRLEHNSLNLDQFKVKLCSDFKVLERPLCARSGTWALMSEREYGMIFYAYCRIEFGRFEQFEDLLTA